LDVVFRVHDGEGSLEVVEAGPGTHLIKIFLHCLTDTLAQLLTHKHNGNNGEKSFMKYVPVVVVLNNFSCMTGLDYLKRFLVVVDVLSK
jgi:hypothetical protein